MNWFQKYKDKRKTKELDRLERNLMDLQKRQLSYNPKHEILNNIMTEEVFSKRVVEYLTWFTATPRLLRYFYQTSILPDDSFNYFWTKAPSDYRMVHSGIPSLISNKMGVILFGGGYSLDVEVFKEDGITPDKDLSQKAKENLIILRNKINLDTYILPKSSATESWCGHLFWKLNYDLSLSQYPIIETADIRNGEVIKKRGITSEIIFKTWYKKGTRSYVLYERYITLDKDSGYEEGTSAIKYELYHAKPTGELILVDLDTIDETSTIEVNDEGLIIFEGVKGLLAFEKPNKLPNNEFIDSPYGASDYQGAISAFDSLDEILTEIVREVRTNKTFRYIPTSLLQYNQKGEFAVLNDFIDNYVLVNDAEMPAENKDGKIQITTITDKTLEHLEKWKVALTTAINKSGLSPLALGITGLEAVNAGAQSQRERNKTTLETRALKHEMWQPYLEDFFIRLLEFNSWLQKAGANQPDLHDIDIDYTNTNVSVVFGDYIAETQAEKILTWGSAKSQGVASIETVIDMIHPEWTETQKLSEVQRIKFEQNISMDTPSSLQFEDLLNEPEEPEEDEPIKKLGEDDGEGD